MLGKLDGLIMRTACSSTAVSLREAFTLIELLVVMAIILILASLLLPSLSGAKGRALETVCVNNLHQIGIGLRIYQDDNESRFPPAVVRPINPQSGVVDAPFDVRGTLGGFERRAGYPYNDLARMRPLSAYVSAKESFRCPEDRGAPNENCAGPALRYSKWEELGCSYHYNAGGLTQVAGGGTRFPQLDAAVGLAEKTENWVSEPSLYILVHEPPARPWGCPGKPAIWVQWHRVQGPNLFKDPAVAPQRFVSPTLFVDGHVKIHNFSKALSADPRFPYERTRDWIWYRPAEGEGLGR